MGMEYNMKMGMKIEMYARENIPEEQEEYGEFMYHAELIKRGHWDIHQEDLSTMREEYQEIIMEITQVDMEAYEYANRMLEMDYDG